MRTLVTGFGPFGNLTVNPSGQLADELGSSSNVVSAILPTSFTRATVEIDQWISKVEPELVIMLGWADDASGLRVERVARRDSGNSTDIDGDQAPDRSGPTTLKPNLKSDALRMIPFESTVVTWSDDAGGYVCNYLYYHVLCNHDSVPAIFMHMSAEKDVADYKRARRFLKSTLAS